MQAQSALRILTLPGKGQLRGYSTAALCRGPAAYPCFDHLSAARVQETFGGKDSRGVLDSPSWLRFYRGRRPLSGGVPALVCVGNFGLHEQEAATADGTFWVERFGEVSYLSNKGDRTAVTDDLPFEASGVRALGASLVSATAFCRRKQ